MHVSAEKVQGRIESVSGGVISHTGRVVCISPTHIYHTLIPTPSSLLQKINTELEQELSDVRAQTSLLQRYTLTPDWFNLSYAE